MTITPEPQGPRLRPGEFLHESSLSSPSGRFTLRNGIRGGSSLIDNATEVELWKVPDTNVYGSSSLVFGLDGDLMVWNHHRDRGWSSDTAGSGAEVLRVTDVGNVELVAADGRIVWSSDTAPGTDPFPPYVAQPSSDQVAPTGGAFQQRLQNLFDSLAPAYGYTVAVLFDATPEEALHRWGLPMDAVGRATWQELQSRRGDGEVPIAAVSLGSMTLLVAGAPWLPGDPLSVGTTVVRESRVPGTGWATEFSLHQNGRTVSHLREATPKRRIGMDRPELLLAVQASELEEHLKGDADWMASLAGLELLSRVAGVSPAADDLNGELLGGLVPASVAQPPEEIVKTLPPGRPPIPAEDFLLVRTDFSDDAQWAAILEEVADDEFFEGTEIRPVNDRGWEGAGMDEVMAAVTNDEEIPAVYIADAEAMTGWGHPLLVINADLPEAGPDYEPGPGVSRTLRATADSIWSMHVNLEIANMDWEDYLPDPDSEDPVHRGF